MQKPSIPKGTRDFGPVQTQKRKYIQNVIESAFQKYQFKAIETPAMENLSVLMGKYGDEGDKLLFKILNSGDFLKKTEASNFEAGHEEMIPLISEKGLRYDLTVPFARFVAMNQNEINFPFKRYQIQPVWRADRPQRGRYREFYQCDADIVGSRSIWNEIELTLLIEEVFSKLGFNDYEIKINHREVLFKMAELSGVKGQEIPFCVALDKLDKIGSEKVLEELSSIGAQSTIVEKILAILDSTSDNLQKIAALREIFNDDEVFVDLDQYFKFLETVGNEKTKLKISLDFSLARGLTYYTGMIFEVKPTKVKMGSICGGGRYDNLTGVFGLSGVSGVGISFGMDRIYDILDELGLFPNESLKKTKVLITHFDENSMIHGMKVLTKLREEGIDVELYPEHHKIKKQMTYANKEKIEFVITIGQEEIETGNYSLKDMETGDKMMLSTNEILSKLLN